MNLNHLFDLSLTARRDHVALDIDQRDAGAVRREHLAVREPEPAGASGDDDAEAAHVEP